MKETFERKLDRVAGTVRRVIMDDPHRRYRDGLLYWSNKAQRLHDAALVLGGDPAGLHFEAFALLAGSSIEVLIKGMLIGLGEELPFTHNILDLTDKAGLALSDDDRAILSALTVYTTWYSRYPVAKNSKEMIQGREIVKAQYPSSGNLGKIVEMARSSPVAVNEANYERLYGFFRDRFFDVQSSVRESASFSFDPPE